MLDTKLKISNIRSPAFSFYLSYLLELASKQTTPANVAARSLVAGSARTLVFVLEKIELANELKAQLLNNPIVANVYLFPSLDNLLYNLGMNNKQIQSERISTLYSLIKKNPEQSKLDIVITTFHAIVQKILPPESISKASLELKVGDQIEINSIAKWCVDNGLSSVPIVRDINEFTVRGGLIDIYPNNIDSPIRLDFFDNFLEQIREFDPYNQRTIESKQNVLILPSNECNINSDTKKLVRSSFYSHFGQPSKKDAIYGDLVEGRRVIGLEQWYPFFHKKLVSFFDYLPPDSLIFFDSNLDAELDSYWQYIVGSYEQASQAFANLKADEVGVQPIPYELAYFRAEQVRQMILGYSSVSYNTFANDSEYNVNNQNSNANKSRAGGDGNNTEHSEYTSLNLGCVKQLLLKAIDSQTIKSSSSDVSYHDYFRAKIAEILKVNKIIVFTYSNDESYQKLKVLFIDALAKDVIEYQSFPDFGKRESFCFAKIHLVPTYCVEGFSSEHFIVISDNDIFHVKRLQNRRRRHSSKDFIELQSLNVGDYVVHIDYGVGQFKDLVVYEALGKRYDCMLLHYAGGNELYLPVENLDLVSRYKGSAQEAQLDSLGGKSWSRRLTRAKKKIYEISSQLMKTAAMRKTIKTNRMFIDDDALDAFCAAFPYQETESQLTAIDDVLNDLISGQPMDRIICGDVGFGKTEVALRAAFIAVTNGYQVAIVTPTTILCRQHFNEFSKRFANFDIKVVQFSRFVSQAQKKVIKQDLKNNLINIVIATNSLVYRDIEFGNLGLVIIDEEHKLGVNHKEKLKRYRHKVHVLTMTATPIPRTLQMGLSGVRDFSLINTPPFDRYAIRNSINTFNDRQLREVFLFEKKRGGQSYFITPRIRFIDKLAKWLEVNVPECSFAVTYGKMSGENLENVLLDFYDGKIDILLSTNIIESGIDVANANTMVIYCADLFGLSQLYQIRGRIGRSNRRSNAYLVVDKNITPTDNGFKRLEILDSLTSLGAGFQIASHDLDLRGGGNLLGDEQSGHIEELGYELYQKILNQAVQELKQQEQNESQNKINNISSENYNIEINLSFNAFIPEIYISNKTLRLNYYMKLSNFTDIEQLRDMQSELIDCFGPLPEGVKLFLRLIALRIFAKKCNIQKIDAGRKGLSIGFYKGVFHEPEKLLEWIAKQNNDKKYKVSTPHGKGLYIEFAANDFARRLMIANDVIKQLNAILLSDKQPE